MPRTPLDLYEEAYRLHYRDHNPAEAIRIYESLIRAFPESNECAYSVIQLQKIKAGDIATALKKNKAPSYMFNILSFATAIASICFTIIVYSLMSKAISHEQERSEQAIVALCQVLSGNETDALKAVEQIKSNRPLDDSLVIVLQNTVFKRHEAVPDGAPRRFESIESNRHVSSIERQAQKNEMKNNIERQQPSSSTILPARNQNQKSGSPDSISYF